MRQEVSCEALRRELGKVQGRRGNSNTYPRSSLPHPASSCAPPSTACLPGLPAGSGYGV